MTEPRDPQPLSVEARALDRHVEIAARVMRRRLDDGARKFGALSWRTDGYSDNDNAARLLRAVDHLFAALTNWRRDDARLLDASEVQKRAADVANQAFMLADVNRRQGSEPFTNPLTLDAARSTDGLRSALEPGDGNASQDGPQPEAGAVFPEGRGCPQCDGTGFVSDEDINRLRDLGHRVPWSEFAALAAPEPAPPEFKLSVRLVCVVCGEPSLSLTDRHYHYAEGADE